MFPASTVPRKRVQFLSCQPPNPQDSCTGWSLKTLAEVIASQKRDHNAQESACERAQMGRLQGDGRHSFMSLYTPVVAKPEPSPRWLTTGNMEGWSLVTRVRLMIRWKEGGAPPHEQIAQSGGQACCCPVHTGEDAAAQPLEEFWWRVHAARQRRFATRSSGSPQASPYTLQRSFAPEEKFQWVEVGQREAKPQVRHVVIAGYGIRRCRTVLEKYA
ncbi:hypothetical protein AVEN_243346-1 [Araneus ventricosus]|uniref:Uncharacterized protein n=1 Tax=Araneus ventricosus TaxID=182803 RepID=A0A4Y2HBD1_ARAVE|nr:hypothetical protein AVEN_243346-1 [Araneus ventricosus]